MGAGRRRVTRTGGLSNKLFLTLESSRSYSISREESQGRLVLLRLSCAEHSPRPCVKTQTLSPGARGSAFLTSSGQQLLQAGWQSGQQARVSPLCPLLRAGLGAVAYCFSPPCPGLERGDLPCAANTQDSNIHPKFRRRPSVRRKQLLEESHWLGGEELRPAGNQSGRDVPLQGVLCARLRRVGAGPLSRPEDELHGPRYTDEGPRVQRAE